MRSARLRLASLWLSQTARALADNCLRMFVILQVAQAGGKVSEAAWHQVTPFFILPFILLAPVNGALSNGLPKRWVLVGSTAYCLAVSLLLGVLLPMTADAGWWWCAGLGLSMIGTAVYSPTRYALLPAVAEDARVPLSRVTGWIEMGSAAAVVIGFLLAVELHGLSQTTQGFPPALAVVVGLNVVGLLTGLPAHFPADVRRPESPGQAIAGFFRDTRRIWQEPEARGSLLGLACFLALVGTGGGAILAMLQERGLGGEAFVKVFALVGLGVALGSLIASIQGHPYRALGLVPFGSAGLVAVLIWAAVGADLDWPCLVLGTLGGLVNVPLRATYQAAVPADARGNGMAVLNTIYYLMLTGTSVLMFSLVRWQVLTPTGQFWLLAGVATVAAGISGRVLRRPAIEQAAEIILWPIYRIRPHGPGVGRVPLRGPLLVVANHTAWFDPVWLGKVMPRRLIPMMTSEFYDRPGLRWLMAEVIQAIRVQASSFRREAPELQHAVVALDRGDMVTIFPEGRLRRKAEASVRNFGQGVWHILQQRPETPVVVCWIEGGWGSYTSYFNGPPTVNKRFDWWRHLDIAITEPQFLKAEVLADPRATRTFLMRACLDARRFLGLEVPSEEDSGEDEPGKEASADQASV